MDAASCVMQVHPGEEYGVLSSIPDYLSQVHDECAAEMSGFPADYIPELASVDRQLWGLALSTVDGNVYAAGDVDVGFTIQSISKPFVYALAIADRGLDAVLEKVGVEPSGEAFNELSLERDSKRPRNPMINAGAITAHSLIGSYAMDENSRVELIIDGLSTIAGRQLSVDETVYKSEARTAHRNLAIAHMLRSYDLFEQDPEELVDGYTRQCAIRVTVRDLAMMAATLANGGVQPVTGEEVMTTSTVRQVLSVMTTCGMYDAAGDWVTTVGIPAKSGVAGGLIGTLPGQIGIAAFSPRLDVHGHSVRAVRACERLSQDMNLHLMEVAPPAHAIIRQTRMVATASGEAITVHELQGSIHFAGVERLLRNVDEQHSQPAHLAFDFTSVYQINDAARRMFLDAVRKMVDAGYAVSLIDPDEVLPEPVDDEELSVNVVSSMAELTA